MAEVNIEELRKRVEAADPNDEEQGFAYIHARDLNVLLEAYEELARLRRVEEAVREFHKNRFEDDVTWERSERKLAAALAVQPAPPDDGGER